ncbi:MAG: hypothetical protein IJM15_04885 [Erysipelotrichaceae bacterium]|nr:hypothetical protein [Erysipelotrichaceae bacterium]
MKTAAEIIEEIRSKLTYDAEKDFPYLLEVAEEYKENRAVLEEIGNIMFSHIGEQYEKDMAKVIEEDLKMPEAYRKVSELMEKKQLKEAAKTMEELIDKVERLNWFLENDENVYFNFNEPFEEDIYRYFTQDKRTIRIPLIDMANMYLSYGSILVELKKFSKAISMLEKALSFNPVSTAAGFEYLEALKGSGEYEDYYEKCMEIHRYCFRRNDVARNLRNLGYYFTIQQEYSVACSCYMVSMAVLNQRHPIAMQEIRNIEMKGFSETPDMDQSYRILEELGLPYGPSDETASLAYSGYRHFIDLNMSEAAKYYLSIACNLTEDEDLEKELRNLTKVS